MLAQSQLTVMSDIGPMFLRTAAVASVLEYVATFIVLTKQSTCYLSPVIISDKIWSAPSVKNRKRRQNLLHRVLSARMSCTSARLPPMIRANLQLHQAPPA